MGSTDYKDVKGTPAVVADATAMMVRNAVHLARLLQERPLPGSSG
jgi:hypothetical protein